jgi:mono/diheme cytochrome c family protein
MACAPKTPPAAVATPPAPAPASTAAAASNQLPDGAGRQILMSACVACHGLREVTKFRGFYTRQQWRDIVLTMVDYGAPVSEKDAEVLTDYLTANLGKKQP